MCILFMQVQSKPDLYPLVITCAEGDGKSGGNYLMVHYFRNYVIRPPAGNLFIVHVFYNFKLMSI